MKMRVLFFVLLFSPFLFLAREAGAATVGTLVKASGPAVYYYAEDENRYTFPNEKVFFSWFRDFSDVQEISDEELADIPLAGAITYRPGTRLVKLITDPKVYAVEYGGVLRWITDEDIAKTLYGDNWAGRVDDLSDAFFPQYVIGGEIDSNVHPDGSLIKYVGSDENYIIWQGQERKITDDAFLVNSFQKNNVIAVDQANFSYISGMNLTSAEAVFTDPSEQNGVVRQQASAVFSSSMLRSVPLVQGESARVLGFVLQTVGETVLTETTLNIRAYTDDDLDSDKGGLVNGEDGRLNLQNIHIEDIDGNRLLSSGGLVSGDSNDKSQSIVLSGGAEFAPGVHSLFIVLEVDDETVIDQEYAVTLTAAKVTVDGDDDDYNVGIAGNRLAVTSGGLSVSLGSGIESTFYVGGGHVIDSARFDFETTGSDTITITEITVTGYIDEGEGDADFGAGIDEDDSGFTGLEDLIDTVELLDESGEVLGSVGTLSSDGRITFRDLSVVVEPGSKVSLTVRAYVSVNAPFELGSDRFSFDIDDADEDIELTDSELDITGDDPNGGTSPNVWMKISDNGALSLSTASSSGTVVFDQENASIMTLTFSADEVEDFIVEEISFYLADIDAAGSIDEYKLIYTDSAGASQTASLSRLSRFLTFTDLDIHVPADDEADVVLRMDMSGSGSGARSGDQIEVSVDVGAGFRAVGVSSGKVFDDLENDVSVTLGETGTYTVRKNRPIFTAGSYEAPAGVRVSNHQELLSFNVYAEGSGQTEITKLTFMFEPSDVGSTTGASITSDNDLLENWADINGDSADDDDIVELKNVDTTDVVGEGNSASLDFYIYDESTGVLDDTPAGLDTARGDYGIIVYEFRTPLRVGSAAKNFVLSADLRGFSTTDGTLKVTLLGGDSDVAWTDGAVQTLRDLDGSVVSGLPKINNLTVSN